MKSNAKREIMILEESNWLQNFKLVLDKWIGHPSLDNNLLAKEMDISNRQLYRKIKALTKQTPNQYIKKYRLWKAKDFLQSGKYKTVQQVSFMVGFKIVIILVWHLKRNMGNDLICS